MNVAAPRQLELMVDGPLGGGWSLAARLISQSKRRVDGTDFGLEPAGAGVGAPGNATAHLILRYRTGKDEWRLAIHDLADRRVLLPASGAQKSPLLPQPGRELRLSWHTRF